MEDLTKKEAVIKLMGDSTSAAEWDKHCDEVKAANGGGYPGWWYQEIIMGGVLQRSKQKNGWS